MSALQALISFLEENTVPFTEQEPLSRHATLRIGGPARLLASPARASLLPALMARATELDVPVLVLGGGSNSLFPDEGFGGLVIKLYKGEGAATAENGSLTVDSDVLLTRLVKTAAEAGVEGFTGLAGIPGTVGGALVNNAGAYKANISDLLLSVTCCGTGGREVTLNREEILFGYRTSTFRQRRLPIVRASFHFEPEADPVQLKKTMREIQNTRKRKFANIRSNAGSTFKNPEGHSAGALIEQAGLKGHAVGAMRMSQTHANVLENLGGGTHNDALKLLSDIQNRVFEQTGIPLERELDVLGVDTRYGLKDASA